jgi:hypothetical protein
MPDTTPLPKITDTSWELTCQNEQQVQEMLAYAAKQGVPIHSELFTGKRLFLEFWAKAIWTNSESDGSYKQQLTPEQFRAMCDAYATR